MSSENLLGYLPNETPPAKQIMLLSIQHVLTMFSPTVLVALIAGFNVGAVLVGSGLATVTALILSKRVLGKYIPLYYGASFSYIAAITLFTEPNFGQYAGAELVGLAQVGIVASGLLNSIIGLGLMAIGRDSIDRVLPPIVSGSVALVIGLSLSGEAIVMAQENWVVSMVTLISIVFFAIYFRGRGILNFIPILLGIIVGCIIGIPYNLISSSGIQKAPWIQLPVFSLPHFDSPRIIEAILGISVVLLATAPESTAHLHQISLYVDQLAEKIGRDPYRLNRFVGWNLVLDGIGDVINGLIGGIGGTNYGENSSLMAVTNCYSGPVIILSGLIVVLLGFLGKLAAIVQMVPVPVLGGLSIYLFGVIGMQGIAILQEAKVDLFDPRQLGLGAIVCTIGLGGYLHGDGNLEIFISSGFPNGVPSITIAAMIGILLHQVFQWIDKS